MSTWSVLTRTSPLVLTVLLAGCMTSAPREQSPASGSSRYEMKDDSPTLEQLDLGSVRPVVPVLEKRTIAGNKSPYTINGRTYEVLGSEAGYTETGMASWYGRKFHGHLTSNGEVYDMFQLSAAHTRLPIPSYIRVTNLDNGKSILARVNDRGPFHPGRVVDLSYAGAVMLGYADKGTARVRVEAVLPSQVDVARLPAPNAPVVYSVDSIETVATERARIDSNSGRDYLQVGAFANLDSARSLVARLSALTDLPAEIFSDTNSGGILHKVRVGPVPENYDVQRFINALQDAKLGTPFKVRI